MPTSNSHKNVSYAVKRSKTESKEASRLTQDDWLDAAFMAVVEGGFDKARVLILAGDLGVTRGSFYWHFADHAALIQALVQRWHAREMKEIMRLTLEKTDNPINDLERLLDAAMEHAGKHLEFVRFELALRGLGRRDEEVAKLLTHVDRQRLTLFVQKFTPLCADAKQAWDMASLFYLALVGSNQALTRPDSTEAQKSYLKHIIAHYIIRR